MEYIWVYKGDSCAPWLLGSPDLVNSNLIRQSSALLYLTFPLGSYLASSVSLGKKRNSPSKLSAVVTSHNSYKLDLTLGGASKSYWLTLGLTVPEVSRG